MGILVRNTAKVRLVDGLLACIGRLVKHDGAFGEGVGGGTRQQDAAEGRCVGTVVGILEFVGVGVPEYS